ncbi:MAG: hypothetical protein ACI4W2_07390 [Eubacterium sp.]
MLEEIMKEFKGYRDSIYERVSEFMNYADGKHDASTQRIGASEDGICEMSSDLDQRIKDLEDALCELSGDTPTTTEE